MAELSEVGQDIQVTYPIVTSAGFPHGLSCMSCERRIGIGQPYSDSPIGIMDDGSVITSLLCVYC